MNQEDSFAQEPRKSIPKPTSNKIDVSIAPIMSNPIPPFTHFYICISKIKNLSSSQQQSLYLLIRTHPKIKPILSNSVWCSSSEVLFNVGYTLDFSGFPGFQLGSFIPVIELYSKIGKNSKLIGVSLLPMVKKSTEMYQEKPLTFIFKNEPCEIKDILTEMIVGSIHVTIALGELIHQPILDPYSDQFCKVPLPISTIVEPKKNEIEKQLEEEEVFEAYSDYDYYSEDDEPIDIISEAIKHGWLKPGEKIDWKIKAKEAGWVPPRTTGRYNTETYCNLLKDKSRFQSTGNQVDFEPVVLDHVENFDTQPKQSGSPSISEEDISITPPCNDERINLNKFSIYQENIFTYNENVSNDNQNERTNNPIEGLDDFVSHEEIDFSNEEDYD